MARTRSVSEIGAMWPACKRCKHIAQEHDITGCRVLGMGKCKECGVRSNHVRCQCSAYDGPTWEEFSKQLTPDEIRRFMPR